MLTRKWWPRKRDRFYWMFVLTVRQIYPSLLYFTLSDIKISFHHLYPCKWKETIGQKGTFCVCQQQVEVFPGPRNLAAEDPAVGKWKHGKEWVSGSGIVLWSCLKCANQLMHFVKDIPVYSIPQSTAALPPHKRMPLSGAPSGQLPSSHVESLLCIFLSASSL